MKKFLITCFYLTLTLAVCAAGFLLPSALNDYQDRQIFAKIEHTAMEPPELAYSSSLYDTLRLLAKEHYFVEYPSTGSKRTEEEIYSIASDLTEQLKKYNVLLRQEYTISHYTTTLQLAIVSDGMLNTDSGSTQDVSHAKSGLEEYSETASSDITTAVVWNCTIYYQSGCWLSVGIDDKSGKIVSFSLFTDRLLMLTSSDSEEELNAFAASIAEFCGDYYEMPAASLQQSVIRSYDTISKTSNGIIEASYTIQMKEENGEKLQMPLRIFPDYMMLN